MLEKNLGRAAEEVGRVTGGDATHRGVGRLDTRRQAHRTWRRTHDYRLEEPADLRGRNEELLLRRSVALPVETDAQTR
jgi:hypothetical protein